MGKLLRFVSAIFFIAVFSCCSHVRPVAYYYPTPTPSYMGPREQKEIIMRAGRDQGWRMYPVAPNQIVASYERYPKKAVVNIYIRRGEYQMTYRDSRGLLYDGSRISSTYNKWTAKLKKRIDRYFREAAGY